MSVLLSLEKAKSFPAPQGELFQLCQTALRSLGLEVTQANQSSGIIEAQKPSTWPFKSRERISLSLTTDSKIVAVAKIDMDKALAGGDLIIDKFFKSVQELIHNSL
jgi:hypothetical protein